MRLLPRVAAALCYAILAGALAGCGGAGAGKASSGLKDAEIDNAANALEEKANAMVAAAQTASVDNASSPMAANATGEAEGDSGR